MCQTVLPAEETTVNNVLFPISQNPQGYPKSKESLLNFHSLIQQRFIGGAALASRITILTKIGQLQFHLKITVRQIQCARNIPPYSCDGISLSTNSLALSPPHPTERRHLCPSSLDLTWFSKYVDQSNTTEEMLHPGFNEVAKSSLRMLALGEASCHEMGLIIPRLSHCEEAQVSCIERLGGERGYPAIPAK